MSDTNPTAEYFATCTAIAEDIVARCRAGEITDLHDALHEEIDGNHYVIYTHANLQCLAATSNDDAVFDDAVFDDAVFDESGSDALSGCNSAGEVYARMAYYAMRADVLEALNEIDGFDPDDEDSWTATGEEDMDEQIALSNEIISELEAEEAEVRAFGASRLNDLDGE